MKRWIIISVVSSFVLLSYCVYAGNNEELFLQAQQFYHQDEYEKAVDCYNRIEPKGAAVWYNMGNCYYALKNYRDGFIAWKRAQKGASWRMLQAIQHNCARVEKKIHVHYDDTMLNRCVNALRLALSVVPVFGAQLLFIVLWITFLMMIGGLLARKRYGIIVAFVVVLGLLGTVIMVHYSTQRHKHAITVRDNVALLVGPDKHYHVLDHLKDMSIVVIKDERDAWCKVQCNRKQGWVAVEALERL